MRRCIGIFCLIATISFAGEMHLMEKGFGRFGRINDDGLLTLNVKPYECSTPPPMPGLTVRFASPEIKAKVIKIDQTHKILVLENGGSGAPVSADYSLLYPGFSASFKNRASLAFSGADYGLESVSGVDGFQVFLFTQKSAPGMPLALAVRDGLKEFKFQWNAGGPEKTLALQAGEALGELRFITPLGLEKYPAEASDKEMKRLIDAQGELRCEINF